MYKKGSKGVCVVCTCEGAYEGDSGKRTTR